MQVEKVVKTANIDYNCISFKRLLIRPHRLAHFSSSDCFLSFLYACHLILCKSELVLNRLTLRMQNWPRCLFCVARYTFLGALHE